MRFPALTIALLMACTAGLAPASAADGTVFVVPGKPGVPVIIDGCDASYSVVEGEFGLGRPGQVNPRIIASPLFAPELGPARAYYPATGRRPGYGRREIESSAHRRLPPPAPSFHRSWHAESDRLPADVDPAANMPVVVEPTLGWQADPSRHRHYWPREGD